MASLLRPYSSPSAPRPHRRRLVAGLLLATGGWVAGAHAVERYEGAAYARDGGQLLYRETHWRYGEDGSTRRLVLYRCPNGAAFARKRVVETAQPSAPDFDFHDGRDGYREGVRSRAGRREVYVQAGATAALRAKAIELPHDAVIDAGFDAMVRMRWDELGREGGVAVPFLLPSRYAFLDLKLSAAAPLQAQGRAARRLRMSLDRWYGFAIPSIELIYGDRDRRLIEFRGIGTIRDRRGRPLDVRIVFPADAVVRDAARVEVDRAGSVELAASCGAGSPSA